MILLSQIVRRILNEILTYNQLLKYSDPLRKDRAKRMRVKSLPVTASKTGESWNFSYKSDISHVTPRPGNPSGIPHKGRITFSKNKQANAIDIPCSVDCTCEDYRFKYAYANNDHQAGQLGAGSLNKCNGNFPSKTNPYLRPGLCKHLLSLRDYLKTKINESNKSTLEEKLDDIVTRYPNDFFNVEEN